jgi:ribosomal-protein-alanine N-acetyltransferase
MLRTISKSDVSKLLMIENAVHIAPWTAETFDACLQSGYIGWAIEMDRQICGFIIISLSKEECHVLNLGVAHAHQGAGLGRQLMEHALIYAKQQGIGIAYLEVRRSNSRAISLYQKLQFHLVGERKSYYPTVAGYEDALIFAKSLHEEVNWCKE